MKSARRIFSLLLGLTALLVVSSCAVFPLFDIEAIAVQVNASNNFVGVSVTFVARIDNADGYEWDFGDGSTGTGQVVTHFYSTTGIFTVTLRVQQDGRIFTFSKEVDISKVLGGVTPGGDIIAYTCMDLSGVRQICVIDTDGTAQQQLTFEAGDQDSPSINSAGVIAYECDLGVLDDVCVINADGTGFMQLTTTAEDDGFPSINDLGQIAYECDDGNDREICVINSDGSGFMQLTSNTTDDIFPTRIQNGIVAYNCNNDICVVNNDGTGFDTLTTSTNLDTSPEMNSSNQIAYTCFQGVSSVTSEVCAINADGSGFQILTSAAGFDGAPTINDLGQIVYACVTGGDLCRINFDGSGQASFGLPSGNSASLSNSGLIAFRCNDGTDDEICIMNLSGAGFMQLTNNGMDDEQPNIQ